MNWKFDGLITRLCQRQSELIVLFAMSWVGLVLTVGSLFLIELSPTTEVVAMMNLVGLTGMITWTGYVLYRCRDGMPFGRGEPKP
jgi:hypothetical protein